MRFAMNQVLDLEIFDKQGKLVSKLDASKENIISYLGEDEDGIGYIGVNHALVDVDLLKFIADNTEDLTDYEKSLLPNSNYIELGGSNNKECKLIGRTVARNAETLEDAVFIFEAPNAELVNKLDIKLSQEEISSFDFLFKVYPYNDKDSLFKLHI